MTNHFDIDVLRTISSNRLEFPECRPKALASIFIVESSEQIGRIYLGRIEILTYFIILEILLLDNDNLFILSVPYIAFDNKW